MHHDKYISSFKLSIVKGFELVWHIHQEPHKTFEARMRMLKPKPAAVIFMFGLGCTGSMQFCISWLRFNFDQLGCQGQCWIESWRIHFEIIKCLCFCLTLLNLTLVRGRPPLKAFLLSFISRDQSRSWNSWYPSAPVKSTSTQILIASWLGAVSEYFLKQKT